MIFRSGSKELNNERTRLSKPLNTDKTTINAIVPTATPTTEIAEITLIAFLDFLEKRYLFAMYKGKFKMIKT